MYSLSSYLGEILLLNSFINGLKRIGYGFIVIYFLLSITIGLNTLYVMKIVS